LETGDQLIKYKLWY